MEKKKPSSSFSYNFKRSPSPPQVTDGEYISKTSVSTPEEQVFAVDHLTGESGGSKVVSPSLDSRIARLKSRATGKKVAKSFHFPDIPVTTPVVEGPASRKTKPKPKPTFKSPWLPQGRGEYIILFYLYYINII